MSYRSYVVALVVPAFFIAVPGSSRCGEVLRNAAVLDLVSAGVGGAVIIAKTEKTASSFGTSARALADLEESGASDRVLAPVMVASADRARLSGGTGTGPKDGRPGASRSPSSPGNPPANFGLYVFQDGDYAPLGRVQSKVQFGKLRGILGAVLPFIRQKVDINVAGSHASARFPHKRPTFYAYFPPGRDVSKIKLLQCKITGQGFDQRTVASASVLFSAEQNQDEIPCDIGPTQFDNLYRISPREDLPSGEYGFLEGNQAISTTSNITILDVFDFGIDRLDERKSLVEILDGLPAASLDDRAFHQWSADECRRLIQAREGKVGARSKVLGPFKRQWAGLDVYWVDDAFARAFTRLEMLNRTLTPVQADKLVSLLVDPARDQNTVLVSIGEKLGSGRVIGANEGERTPRPYDATLSRAGGKDDAVVAARRVELVPGYAGLWRVTFDRASVHGNVLNTAGRFEFEARLNQNFGFKVTFDRDNFTATAAGGHWKP